MRIAARATCAVAPLWPASSLGAPVRSPQPADERVRAEMARERAALHEIVG